MSGVVTPWIPGSPADTSFLISGVLPSDSYPSR